jgi:serine/threonine protein kinase
MGGDLFALLRGQTLFEEKVAKFYAASISKILKVYFAALHCLVLAFEHMHERDIIHRDLSMDIFILSYQ